MNRRSLAPLLALAALAAALAACSPDTWLPDQASDQPTVPQTTEPADDEATDPQDEPGAVVVPACEGILLESGAVIDGDDLTACMAPAMVAAGSGSQVVENSSGVTHVDFMWDPGLSMSATGAVNFVVEGHEGWVEMDGEWVRGNQDSSDPQEVIAGGIIEAVGALGNPSAMVGMFAQTDWDVVEEAGVPAQNAVSDIAWLLTPRQPFSMVGVQVSDVELWIGADFLGVYFVGTGSVGGVSETTSNTFTQWGEPVEIPDPGGS